jgi:hypothetical protein
MSDYLTWLASRDENRLAVIINNRPEVMRGTVPADLAVLASRLTEYHGIAAALLRQPRPAVQVLTAVLLLGGRASLTQCARVLDPGSAAGGHRDRIRDWVSRVEDFGLAWADDDVVNTAPVVSAVLAVPADWGLPARALLEELSKDALTPTLRAWGLPRQSTKAATVAVLAEAFGDPVRLAGQLDRLTLRQRELLGETDPLDLTRRIADQRWIAERAEAYREARVAGLLLSSYEYSPFSGETPAEVRLALSGTLLPFEPVAPSLPMTEVSADMVARESRAALELFNEAALSVLDHLRGQSVKCLQSGGIGAREITRIAKASRVDPTVVRLVLDLAAAAGLLEQVGSALRWGEVAKAWRDLDAGPRVTLLVEQWPRIPWSPTQSHDAAGRSLALRDPARACPLCRDGRRTTLEEWVRQEGAVDDAILADRVAWIRPLTHTSHREVVEEPETWDYRWRSRRTARTVSAPPMVMSEDTPSLGTVAEEARLLGLVAHGASTPLLRALLANDRAAVVSMAGAMLPAAAITATFGSDLTAVAVGPPSGGLSALLDSCSDRESRGGAVTWRFSTASVRRALDAGWTAAQLAERLAEVAASGLPQPLGYLLADVGRRHGRLRVAPAQAVIRCDDEALLAEVTVDRKLHKLALRLVAPTVAVSAQGDAETIAALRAAGYLPMPESPESPESPEPAGMAGMDVVVPALRQVDVMDRHPRSAPTAEPAVPLEDAAAAAARLVGLRHAPGSGTADRHLVSAIRRANRTLSEPEIDTLAEALLAGQAVRIRYRSASSALTERVVSDLELSGQLLEGWCHLRNAERVFRLSEILSVGYA